jgi:pimeloyl-ACP methyl ester carboxylesterase
MRRLFVIAVLVTACGGSSATASNDASVSAPPSNTTSTSPASPSASPSPTSIDGRVDIGGRSLFLECAGEGSPTIVMETGQGGPHTEWSKVVPAVQGSNRTCAYDRANIGASDKAPTPRTSADVVADLHRLLAAAGIAPPYLLVGHSLGGISMRLFATTYPKEVVGLVFVDPTPTTILDDACGILDAAGCQEIRSEFEPPPSDGVDIIGSATDVQAAGSLPAVPLVVLAADDHGLTSVDPAVRQQFEAKWRARQQELAASVPGGRVEPVSSGHDIPSLHPEAVVAAIRDVLAQVLRPR